MREEVLTSPFEKYFRSASMPAIKTGMESGMSKIGSTTSLSLVAKLI